jgi:hypothetical protein
MASIAASLPAQQTVVTPSAMTNAYGGINNSIPWGPFVPTGNVIGEIMVQQIEDELIGTPKVLRAMAFRHQYTSAHVAKAFTARVTLAPAATMAAGMSATFASNFKVGGASTLVFNGVINFPAQVVYPRPPSPFDARVPFTTPHVHIGTDPLLWEVIIAGTNPVTPTQFYERGPGSTHTAGWVGRGCPISTSPTPLAATGTITSTTFNNSLASGPPSSVAMLLVGDTASQFMSLPLPFNLGGVGSPNCDLNINMITIMLTMLTTATGTAASSIPYTMSPALSGLRLRTQWVALDGSNIVTSNGLDHSVPHNATTGTAWPQNRVYANGWSPTPPTTGTIQSNGLVTEWTY